MEENDLPVVLRFWKAEYINFGTLFFLVSTCASYKTASIHKTTFYKYIRKVGRTNSFHSIYHFNFSKYGL